MLTAEEINFRKWHILNWVNYGSPELKQDEYCREYFGGQPLLAEWLNEVANLDFTPTEMDWINTARGAFAQPRGDGSELQQRRFLNLQEVPKRQEVSNFVIEKVPLREMERRAGLSRRDDAPAHPSYLRIRAAEQPQAARDKDGDLGIFLGEAMRAAWPHRFEHGPRTDQALPDSLVHDHGRGADPQTAPAGFRPALTSVVNDARADMSTERQGAVTGDGPSRAASHYPVQQQRTTEPSSPSGQPANPWTHVIGKSNYTPPR